METWRIALILYGFGLLALIAFCYQLHSYIMQLNERLQKIEEYLEGK